MLKLSKITIVICKKLGLALLFLLLGILATNQYILYKDAGAFSSKNVSATSSLMPELYSQNIKLREQLASDQKRLSETESSLDNKKMAESLLQNEITKSKILAGATDVSGPGVEIDIDHFLARTQLIDLINALRNSDVEALSINETRILTATPMNFFENKEKYSIKAIGNKDILYDVLTRPGGVLDLITTGKVQKNDSLILPKS